MEKETRLRYEMIDCILQTINTKEREIRYDWMYKLLQERFLPSFRDEREFSLFLSSQVNLLAIDYQLVRRNNAVIGLTAKGYDVVESGKGFAQYMHLQKKEDKLLKRCALWSHVLTIASAAASILSFLFSSSLQNKYDLMLAFMTAGFTLGFAARGLVSNRLRRLLKHRTKPDQS